MKLPLSKPRAHLLFNIILSASIKCWGFSRGLEISQTQLDDSIFFQKIDIWVWGMDGGGESLSPIISA